MVRQRIDVEGYWTIYIYYNLSAKHFHIVANTLHKLNCNNNTINEIKSICCNIKNTGFTFTNENKKSSVIGISKVTNTLELLNTIVHELNHITSHICNYYNVINGEEKSAYLTQYIFTKMYNVIKMWL